MRGDILRSTLNPSQGTNLHRESGPDNGPIAERVGKLSSANNYRNSMPLGKISEMMFPQGVVDTPFWFSNIGGNHFPREGFTYRPYDLPLVPFSTQMSALEQDEDVSMSINYIVSKILGGSHYWEAPTEGMVKYLKGFSNRINTDEFSRISGIELLWGGNSFWKVRGNRHISEIESFDELMHLPLDSMSRIWWTPDRIPLWYEFRGANFNGYFRADEIIHLKWNPINASVFGLGYGTALTIRIPYQEDSINGPRQKIRESILDMKYGTQNNIYKSSKRYITRNVYQALNSTPEERSVMAGQIADLDIGEDLVVGKAVNVVELGSQARNYNPAQYMDLVMGALMKALNTYRTRNAQESQHSYANSETSAGLDEIGIASFPQSFTRQLQDKIFKPWYLYNPYFCDEYAMGIAPYPWDDDVVLNFGRMQKKDLTPEQAVALLNIGITSKSVTWREVRKNLAAAGVELDHDSETEIMALQQQSQMMSNPKDDEKPESMEKTKKTLEAIIQKYRK